MACWSKEEMRYTCKCTTNVTRSLENVAEPFLDQKKEIPAEHIGIDSAHIEDTRELAEAWAHEKAQMLRTGSGFLSIVGPILSALALPILNALDT